MRHFRLTATTTAALLQQDAVIHDTFLIACAGVDSRRPQADIFSSLYTSWFGLKRITEHMVRGTKSEKVTLNSLVAF